MVEEPQYRLRPSIPFSNPPPLSEQARVFQSLFPQLKEATFDKDVAESLSKEVEGVFLIPRWKLIAESYNQALFEAFFKVVTHGWSFHCYLGDVEKSFSQAIEERFLHQHTDKGKAMLRIADRQDHGLLVVGVQPMTEESIRRRDIRSALVDDRGFPLGLFEILCIMLGYLPIVSYLMFPHKIIASGDIYAKSGDSRFDFNPALFMWKNQFDVAYDSKGWTDQYFGGGGISIILYGIPPSEA